MKVEQLVKVDQVGSGLVYKWDTGQESVVAQGREVL